MVPEYFDKFHRQLSTQFLDMVPLNSSGLDVGSIHYQDSEDPLEEIKKIFEIQEENKLLNSELNLIEWQLNLNC